MPEHPGVQRGRRVRLQGLNIAGEVVRVHNEADKEFRGSYDGQRYVIPAGGAVIVPTEACWHWCGRQWLIDEPPLKLERTREMERLRLYYGAHFNDPDKTVEEKWEQNKPKLSVTTMDGERFVTMLDDPLGKEVSPASQTVAERNLLSEQVDKLRRELAAMQGRLNSVERGEDQPDEEVPEDSATSIPTGPRRGRER